MTAFHNFALIVETSWAEKVAMLILENLISLVYSFLDKKKNVKKIKRKNLQWKNKIR